jgi:uncharacterized membrane protein
MIASEVAVFVPKTLGERRQRLLVTIIALGAFALRLIHLGRDSLWYDETVSVYLAGQRAAELIAHTARDIHPPLYYLLLRSWLLLAGYPTGQADPAGYGLEFMAAFLSLFFGVLLVPLTWQLARRLGLGSFTAGLAALLIAISPFGVWYSQEVRMYTLGACLGVVVLLATLPFLRRDVSPGLLRRAALLYAVAAAAGMYILYYFAFLLVSLNLLVLAALASRERGLARSGDRPEQLRKLATWLAAQVGALLLFLPWLPTAWRQATNPPVPPWRSAPHLLDVLVESWTALTLGQSADPARFWPLLALALALVVLGIAAARRSKIDNWQLTIDHWQFLLTAAFGPLLLILLASLATPLYHVRYLFTFSPAFSILVAIGLAALWRWRRPLGRWLAGLALGLLVLGSVLSLRAFWTDHAFAADDHRAAVRELAQRWRPGDVILANAGYAYTALLTYWPGPVAWHGRLIDYTQNDLQQSVNGPIILQTGHVDGDPNIGWSDPRSDFYALTMDALQTALRDLSTQTDRLWHYRIYDTVNDPQGTIRAALESGWALIDDRVYSGEANLRVQGWQGMREALSSYLPPTVATFDSWLALALAPDAVPSTVESGAALDIPRALWTRSPDQAGRPVAFSLRLVDANGEVWAAADESLGGNVLDLTAASALAQPLRLAVPPGTAPGAYDLVLVAYDPQTGQPLNAITPSGESAGQVVLGRIEVTRPVQPPATQRSQADFGPLRLVEAATPAAVISPGDAVPLELHWQAAPDFAAEPLVVVVQLLDRDGQVVASLEKEPLGGRYPTSQWQPGELVRDRHVLSLPDDLAPGSYSLIAGLYRATDGQRLEASSGPFGWHSTDAFVVGEIIAQ